jgi:hypothetical protein
MLPTLVKSKAEIPAGLEQYYVEQDGVFLLDADDRGRLAEFRTNNRALKATVESQKAELAALKARFEGVDPDEAKRLAAEHQALIEQQQLKAGETEKVVAARVAAARAEAEKATAALTARVQAAEAKLAATLIDQGVLTLATKRGLRPTAGPDITQRARAAVRLVDGVPTVLESDGQTRRLGKDGVTPMSLEEWIETQASDAPHLFETNAGGGAAGGSPGGAVGSKQNGRNPFLRESWNLTEQMKLMKADPAMAARLKAAAP